jgi:plastocyanin
MRVPTTKSAGAAVVLVIALVLVGLYYPRASPGSMSTVSEILITTRAGFSSTSTLLTSTTSTTQASTSIFVTTRSTGTTNTNNQVTVVIPFGSHYALNGPGGAYYDPVNVTILAGASVTWTNQDNFTHGLQADNGAFYRYMIQPGGSYSFTFNSTGTFTYRCPFHSWMSGEIIVVAAA